MFTSDATDPPQWQIVYDHLITLSIGDVITDRQLRDLLPDAASTSVSGAFHRALTRVESDHSRSFDRVRLIGYRMVQAAEHERLARGQHKRANRRLKAAVRKAHSADRALLQPDERRRIDAVEDHLGRLASMTSRLSARVEQHDRELATVRREQRTEAAETGERLDALVELLARHGITADRTTSDAERDS